MVKNSVLICHTSPADTEGLAQAVAERLPATDVLTTDNLTAAYNLTEHKQPLHIIVEARLAATRDFELLHSLVKILKIHCWVMGDLAVIPRRAAWSDIRLIPRDRTMSQIVTDLQTADCIPMLDRPGDIVTTARDTFREGSMILIGASTGGVDALATVLSHLSKTTPPALIVQHTGGSFTNSLIRLLDNVTSARVRPAIDGETPKSGCVYLAPSDDLHICLAGKNTPRIALRDEGPLSGHRPSIDALFRSARPFANNVAAALLTGMGQDGARGLLLLRQAGVHTIGQDAGTSVVYGMPRVAMEIGAVAQQLPIHKIGPALLANCTSRIGA